MEDQQQSDNNPFKSPPQSQDSVEEVETVLGRFSLFVKDLSSGLSNPSRDGTPSEEPAAELAKPPPVVILGREFDNQQEAISFIESKLWLSYRCGFDPIPKSPDGPQPIQFFPSVIFNKTTIYSNFANLKGLFDKDNFTSDAGWGCMIRTSQNLLANSLLQLLPDSKEHIIDLFQDNLQSPFSLHNFIMVAGELPLQVKPGQWFGPNAASLSIKRLTDRLEDKEIEKGIKYPKVFISENCDLYDDAIRELFKDKQDEGIRRSVLILFPIRLGIDKVNSYYYNSIFQFLRSKYSCGISGGKPSSSFYFLGFEESDLIYFDPHLPQLIEDPINLDSYHTRNYNKLNISLLDPSMMIGILLQSMDDYLDFKTSCIDNSNKIVHFHPHVLPTQQQQDSLINQSWEEVQDDDEDEDFVNLNVNKVEDEEVEVVKKQEDEFIDLGKQEEQN